jgi:hypothetical protein
MVEDSIDKQKNGLRSIVWQISRVYFVARNNDIYIIYQTNKNNFKALSTQFAKNYFPLSNFWNRFQLHVSKEYLQLEPIGLVFVFFFALILIIQFMAMLFHRFGTISHILASTELNWYCNKKVLFVKSY